MDTLRSASARNAVDFSSLSKRKDLSALAGGISGVCHVMTGFPDPGLFDQMLMLSSVNPSRIALEGKNIECSDDYLAKHLAIFTKTALEYFGEDTKVWRHLLTHVEKGPRREAALVRMAYRAMMLDSMFCNAEGRKDLKIKPDETLRVVRIKLESLESETSVSAKRFTPLGMPTDDTQFMLSGIVCAITDPSHFAENILKMWSKMAECGIWRNEGRRLRSLVRGNNMALRGKVTLGDILRFATFAALADETERYLQFSKYCQMTHLSEQQVEFGRTFIELHDAVLMNKRAEGKAKIKQLRRSLSNDDEYMRSFLQAVDQHVIDDRDLIGFVSSMQDIGSDYDTFAFLAGLLMPEGTLDATDVRPMANSFAKTVLNVLLAYIFRETMPAGFPPSGPEVLKHYFAGEIETRDQLRTLRACKDQAELSATLARIRSSDSL
jgi:hypothetical protein